ncbi:hypothetical protein TRAPUB_6499 [Trametes pubescens]|uniref:Uncharacterized protein n=1 Tax=Trametes pubescens TaxID=154538 RepID=A0A1M2V5Q7_TRAPU|nr:hypothetical protein TRAPUB_6499 [Trametes pubescens]
MPGHAAITGATVYYLYDVPATADLKHELEVLQSFVAKWNADTPDSIHSPAWLPSGTKAPPPLLCLLITKYNHKSTHASSANQGKHISAYVVNQAGWNLQPIEYGATVHVFAVNEDPAQGYHDYYIHSKARAKINSAVIQAALAAAKANNLGTLGKPPLN